MSHLERRSNLWYAVLTVPKDARVALGGRLRFVQSLKTPSKPIAARRAAPLLAKWRAQIDQGRGRSDAVLSEALMWKEALAATMDHDDHHTLSILLTDHSEHIETTKGSDAAQSFYNIASGHHTPSTQHFAEWESQIALAPKTKDQMTKDVQAMVTRFPVLESITKKEVRKWLVEEINASTSTVGRIASFCRNYWGYLQRTHAVPEGDGPFTKLDIGKATKKATGATGSWVPFAAQEVVDLWKLATDKGDTELGDLIALGAYSGARIEEICSPKVTDCSR